MAIVITKQPINAAALAGDTVSFAVEATGEGLKYQWKYRVGASGSWVTSNAAGSRTNAISFVAQSHMGSSYRYCCVITDASGNSVTTEEARLTVYGSLTITKQPESIIAQLNDKVVFSVEAVGAASYQWEWRASDTKSWGASTLYGNKTSALPIDATSFRNGYQYRCVITDASGNRVVSDVVILTVVTVGFINHTTLTAIADAIRAKTGSTAKMTPSEMIDAINQI